MTKLTQPSSLAFAAPPEHPVPFICGSLTIFLFFDFLGGNAVPQPGLPELWQLHPRCSLALQRLLVLYLEPILRFRGEV